MEDVCATGCATADPGGGDLQLSIRNIISSGLAVGSELAEYRVKAKGGVADALDGDCRCITQNCQDPTGPRP